MRRPEASAVLRELARTLDITATLAHFPGLSAGDLARILEEAAGPVRLSSRGTPLGPLFAPSEKAPAAPSRRALLFVDGGARGNPGPAGVGAVLHMPGADPEGRGEYIGEATNNVAEYRALLLGLALAREMGAKRLAVHSDSELLVRQLTGVYRVKHPDLKPLHQEARRLASGFESVSWIHVPREKNHRADELVNRAIDARGKVRL